LKTYTVCSTDGEFIAVVTREQRNRLIGCTEDGLAPRHDSHGDPVFGAKLIQVHKKRDALYFALVDAAVIRAELQRDIASAFPMAEDNQTCRREAYANEKGAGWYYELHLPHSFAFLTTAASMKEQQDRHFLRAKRKMHSNLTLVAKDKADHFPVAQPVIKTNVIPFPARTQPTTEHLPEAA
jgi:hypothetical protein